MDESGGSRLLRGGGILVVLALVVVGALTNPDLDRHKERIYAHARSEAATEGFWASIGAQVAEAVDVLDSMPITYHNYIVCSTVTHKDDLVTVGLLGTVLVIDDGD